MNINIDEIVNYEQEYNLAVQNAKIAGNRLTGLCPFHNERNASFSVDLTTGKYCCFACGASGNYIGFVAALNNVDNAEAMRMIKEKYHITDEEKRPAKSYTTEDYAKEKHLPIEWLQSRFGLSSEKEKDGTAYIKMPYRSEGGKQVLFRKRMAPGAKQRFKWSYNASGKLLLYGEWQLDAVRTAGKVLLVEGESDTQTLWYLGFPALGVPGASVFHENWTEKFAGVDEIYIHIEPDMGGRTFLEKVSEKLKKGGYAGKVLQWRCLDSGCKDPSELFIKHGRDEAARLITEILQNAKPVESELQSDDVPIRLEQPQGWRYGKDGIFKIDSNNGVYECVCRTPIILSRRLRNLDTGEEKIEIMFKRDKQWRTAAFPRSVIFQTRSVSALSDLGCTVTSENAKHVVKFLEALENANFEALEVCHSTSVFGWQADGSFLPGNAPELVLDIDPSLQMWANGYAQAGTLDDWIAVMREHRNGYKFRFILAAAFAAPLLKILKIRPFFLYNWGDSKGGKTAALKGALSAWGNPDKLMANFNATRVALERMAGFFNDLPLGIDERQLAGNKQEGLETIVYMLAGGVGRARGNKSGGLQKLSTWRSIIMATGEEPIIRDSTQTGVSTRMLEIIGGPFDKEEDAAAMHRAVADNYGTAGPAFVRFLMNTDKNALAEEYKEILKKCTEMSGGKLTGHMSYIAAVALADRLIGTLFFGSDKVAAEAESIAAAAGIVSDLIASMPPDVNESACRFIADWLQVNDAAFSPNAKPCYGNQMGGVYYVLPTPLREALEDAGFSYRKTVKWLGDHRLIDVKIKPDGGVVNTVTRRFSQGSMPARCLKIDYIAMLRVLDDIEKSNKNA